MVLQRRWAEVMKELNKSHAQVARRYNQGRVAQPFKVGDLVYYKNHPISQAARGLSAKLLPRYKGPYKVSAFPDTCNSEPGRSPVRTFCYACARVLVKTWYQPRYLRYLFCLGDVGCNCT
jgi:hypothetical protein